MGRVAARGIETLAIAEQLNGWIGQLEANMNSGNLAIHNKTRWEPASWPAEAVGWGTTEAPRAPWAIGFTSKTARSRTTRRSVATVWNGSPRDAAGQRGPWEQSLIGTPVADSLRPVEILRTIHSFDSVHGVRGTRRGRRRQRGHSHSDRAVDRANHATTENPSSRGRQHHPSR